MLSTYRIFFCCCSAFAWAHLATPLGFTVVHIASSTKRNIAVSCLRQVPELPPSSVSSLVWAYAKMGHPSAELMERVVSSCVGGPVGGAGGSFLSRTAVVVACTRHGTGKIAHRFAECRDVRFMFASCRLVRSVRVLKPPRVAAVCLSSIFHVCLMYEFVVWLKVTPVHKHKYSHCVAAPPVLLPCCHPPLSAGPF